MDISHQFTRKKVFRNNLGTYDLTLCRWKGLNSTLSRRKEICNVDRQGYVHAATKLKDTIYTIIGPDQHHPTQSMHSFNFRSCEWREWPDCNLPEGRDSFGFTTHLNELYLFGGSNEERQFGDTYIYSTFSSVWKLMEGNHPQPRNPMVFTDVKGLFVLLFGGINIESGQILEDAHVLVEGIWKELEVVNSPGKIIGASVAVCGQKVFLFGGEIYQTNGECFSNKKLFQLVINSDKLKMEFAAVDVLKGGPSPRTSHCMIGIDMENMILLGGIGLEGSKKEEILRDMWLFNVEEVSWTRVDPMNGILRGFCDSSLCLFNNKLHVIGGRTLTLDTWNQQISIIEFGEDESVKNEICSNCQQRTITRQKEEKSFPKSLVISVGFLYNISLEIKHPFQAISAISQCASYLDAKNFSCCISKGLTENEYLEMEWDGRSLSKTEFEELICHSATKDAEYSKFINLLKIAALRIGKTLVFINNDKTHRKVFILSADSKICPEFDENYTYFGYIQNLEKDMIQSHEGRTHQKVVHNILKARLSNPHDILNKKEKTSLLIFDKNILITSQKTYYYELIASSFDDMTVFKNTKKLAFLQEVGYSLAKEPELSLRTYMSLRYLGDSKMKFFLNSEEEVANINYLDKLKELEMEGAISRVDVSEANSEELSYDSWVYRCEMKNILSNNYGVLVYYQGELVNRLDTKFGDFFKEQFYKSKYKGPETIFQYLGIININNGLTLNYFATWFNKTKVYYTFMDIIKTGLKRSGSSRAEQEGRVKEQEMEQRRARLK